MAGGKKILFKRGGDCRNECAEIWAPLYCSKLECVQTRYFKSIFHWPRNVPNHYVRIEVGLESIETEVLKKMVRWWHKVQLMDGNRLPKICLNILKSLSNDRISMVKFNWYTQLKGKLDSIDAVSLLNTSEMSQFKDEFSSSILKFQNNKFSLDINAVLHSNYNPDFRKISSLTLCEQYLSLRVPIIKHKLISQMRLCQPRSFQITSSGFRNSFQTDISNCPICSIPEREDLQHFLLKCLRLQSYRDKYLNKYISSISDVDVQVQALLDVADINKLNDLFYFITSAFKMRNFVLSL
uniref:Reverse transcriptase zinc-binding domain-containing protein n=1 Tax=Rhodnius prolixus TaxID=13249 RepID=T1HGT0_RHOPR